MKLIDKGALVAEIEKLERDLYPNFYEYNYDAAKVELLEKIENFINTLEVKEVDIEEEARKWQDKVYLESGYQDSYGTPHAPFHEIGDAFIAGANFMIKAQKEIN